MVAGNLVIKLRKAKLKRNTELFGSMDPYVEVKVGDEFVWKSQIIYNGGTHPDFYLQDTSFELRDSSNNIQFISLKLYDFESMKS